MNRYAQGTSFLLSPQISLIAAIPYDLKGGAFMIGDMDFAVELLWKKAKELGRLLCKEDFVPIQVMRIKRLLGPWPRALKAAGLKTPKARRIGITPSIRR